MVFQAVGGYGNSIQEAVFHIQCLSYTNNLRQLLEQETGAKMTT